MGEDESVGRHITDHFAHMVPIFFIFGQSPPLNTPQQQ